MKNLAFIFLLLLYLPLFGQVGIGVLEPQAELHVASNDNDIPALKLEPQSYPVGTHSGQISVIDNELFLYDATRSKWLGIEANKYSFGLEDGADNEPLEYVGDVQNNGPIVKEDCTIVYIAINSRSGQDRKRIQMIVDNVNVPYSNNCDINGLIELQPYSYINTDYNYDLDAGQTERFFVTGNGGATNDISVDIWIKKRN